MAPLPDDDRASDVAAPATATPAARLRVAITGMAYGGKGVGRVDGKVLFVDGAIEGDELDVEITSDSGRYADARIAHVVTPSALRGDVACPHAEVCGGCQWMGVASDQQLAWKRSFVQSALTRIGKLRAEAELTVLPSPLPFGYRNRILVRAHIRGGTLRFGYFRRGTHELVPIAACAIAAPALNGLLADLAKLDVSAWTDATVRLEIQEVERVESGANVLVTLYPGEGDRESVRALAARLGALPQVAWAGLVFDLRDAPIFAFDHDAERGLTFATRPGQFQQVNREHNRTLRRLVREAVLAVAPKRVLDVCCGAGNLSLPIAHAGVAVEGVESNAAAIAVATATADAAGLAERTLFLAGDAERHLWKCARANETFDVVVLDPPREGLFKGMVPLKKLEPARIVYVSCDPTTLARDLSYLTKGDEYVVTSVTALDFFPQTFHVETVAILDRAKPHAAPAPSTDG